MADLPFLSPPSPLSFGEGAARRQPRGGEAPGVHAGMGDWLSQGPQHFPGYGQALLALDPKPTSDKVDPASSNCRRAA
jgi:hypothetical protein